MEDLLEACNRALLEQNPESNGIQRRQLFEDIRFMESEQGWSIPLVRLKFGRKVFYRYEHSDFSINKRILNDDELNQIKSAIQLLSRFTGTPQLEWVKEMIPRLEAKLGLIPKKNEVIGFESNIDLKGLQFFSPLFQAIVNERVLMVHYKDFKSPDYYEIIFHPYYLKQFNNRWFVFGLNAANGITTWNLALDRIISIEEIADEYRPSTHDWDDYFYDIVGVTRPADVPLQQIVLKFSLNLAPYIVTKPIHPSQKHHYEDDGLIVRIQLIPNFEFERLVLSFGESVRVLDPSTFKDRIAQRLQAASKLYSI
ncbi:MAG: WYL domain-containing protein [Oceanicaulis sp.]|nr:WYL domain-containing protein [Oceanicaulis sp.]